MDPTAPDPAPDHWRAELARCRAHPGALHVLRTQLPLRFDPDGEFHQIPSLWLCLAGAARIAHQDGHTDLVAGDAVVMEPGAWHRHEPMLGEAATLHLGFTANWCDVSIKRRNWWRIWRLPFQPMRGALEALCAAGSEGQRRQRLGHALDALAAGPWLQMDAASRPLWLMLGGMWRLAYDESVSAEEVLRKSGMSRCHAYRLFTAFYGTGPARAIEVMRLDLARWLLFRGGRIGEVARTSGFPTRHAFTKRWVAQFTAPPRRFRGELAPLPAAGYASNHRR